MTTTLPAAEIMPNMRIYIGSIKAWHIVTDVQQHDPWSVKIFYEGGVGIFMARYQFTQGITKGQTIKRARWET